MVAVWRSGRKSRRRLSRRAFRPYGGAVKRRMPDMAAGAYDASIPLSPDAVIRDRLDRGFDKTRFVQRIRVDSHLGFCFLRDVERAIDGRGRCAPIFMEF